MKVYLAVASGCQNNRLEDVFNSSAIAIVGSDGARHTPLVIHFEIPLGCHVTAYTHTYTHSPIHTHTHRHIHTWVNTPTRAPALLFRHLLLPLTTSIVLFLCIARGEDRRGGQVRTEGPGSSRASGE